MNYGVANKLRNGSQQLMMWWCASVCDASRASHFEGASKAAVPTLTPDIS